MFGHEGHTPESQHLWPRNNIFPKEMTLDSTDEKKSSWIFMRAGDWKSILIFKHGSSELADISIESEVILKKTTTKK